VAGRGGHRGARGNRDPGRKLAGIRYDPDPRRSDVDLERPEITVPGNGDRARVARIGHEAAARALDRHIRVRSRHAQAWRRAQLWLEVNNRGR
jgi:site-specific recombinase XerC